MPPYGKPRQLSTHHSAWPWYKLRAAAVNLVFCEFVSLTGVNIKLHDL